MDNDGAAFTSKSHEPVWLINRLRELQKLKTGEPMPSWLPANAWGEPLSKLCGDAADRIEELERALRDAS